MLFRPNVKALQISPRHELAHINLALLSLKHGVQLELTHILQSVLYVDRLFQRLVELNNFRFLGVYPLSVMAGPYPRSRRCNSVDNMNVRLGLDSGTKETTDGETWFTLSAAGPDMWRLLLGSGHRSQNTD